MESKYIEILNEVIKSYYISWKCIYGYKSIFNSDHNKNLDTLLLLKTIKKECVNEGKNLNEVIANKIFEIKLYPSYLDNIRLKYTVHVLKTIQERIEQEGK